MLMFCSYSCCAAVTWLMIVLLLALLFMNRTAAQDLFRSDPQ